MMVNVYLCKRMKLCAPKRGRSPNVGAHNLPLRGNTNISYSPERKLFMAKHLNPLEKEFLIRKFKGGSKVKLGDFCWANNISETSFKKWLKQYEEAGIEGLARSDSGVGDILPEGVGRSKEEYKREILRLRIENERLKKKYLVRVNEDGQTEYVR